MSHSLSLLDVAIVVGCFMASLLIGAYFSRKQTGTSSFFLGEGKMPGWLVGFSITASMISAMTCLANPGYSFKEDLRWVLPGFTFMIMAVFSMFFVVPFFRKVTVPSGYAFLERRFGTWARVYAAGGFLLFQLVRLGVVLYVTCLSLEVLLGIPVIWIMLAMGVVATVYTMAGGFQAVVWTEFFQTLVLVAGGLVLLPAALHAIPGGTHTVLATAIPAGKMSLGSTHFTLTEKTLWVMIISTIFLNASDYTTRQNFIQRYRAPRSLGQARLALAIGAFTVVPIWIYFNLVGTALWVLYQKFPDPAVAAFAISAPEKIVPYFIATRLPAGLSGLVLAGVLMASLATMAPILNAAAVTWVSDFYQRFYKPDETELHYLKISRISTVMFGVIMIAVGVWIHATRTQTMQDLHATLSMVLSAGLFGLFIIGFFSKRTGNKAALMATVCTLTLVIVWLVLRLDFVQRLFPAIAGRVPDVFWVPVFSNILLPALALFFARLVHETPGDISDLTFTELAKKAASSLPVETPEEA